MRYIKIDRKARSKWWTKVIFKYGLEKVSAFYKHLLWKKDNEKRKIIN